MGFHNNPLHVYLFDNVHICRGPQKAIRCLHDPGRRLKAAVDGVNDCGGRHSPCCSVVGAQLHHHMLRSRGHHVHGHAGLTEVFSAAFADDCRRISFSGTGTGVTSQDILGKL